MNEYETEKLWEEFTGLVTRVGVFARLAELCRPYIGRMSNQDREAILEIALGMAWTGIVNFNPNRRSLISYWDDCLRNAVDTRPIWRLRYGDFWVLTPSDEIGVEEEDEYS